MRCSTMANCARSADVLLAVGAPGDLLFKRLRRQVVAGGHLIAGMKHGVDARVRNLDRSLKHGDPRALDSRIDREHCSCDGNAAVGSLYIQVAGGAFGGLDDDVPAIECDGHVAAPGTHFEGGSLVDSTVEPSERRRTACDAPLVRTRSPSLRVEPGASWRSPEGEISQAEPSIDCTSARTPGGTCQYAL